MSAHFYTELTTFEYFEDFSSEKYYTAAPTDWWVVITDVKGSTKAIESGKYKDVNTVGAAAIAALHNVLPKESFPFVFGGDGMSALIPPHMKEVVSNELCAVAEHSKQFFDLELRVGMISVQEVIDGGASIRVAKYKLVSGQSLAMFTGGGLGYAEECIKRDIERYGIQSTTTIKVNLDKLSCNWQAIPASQDVILSLLVQHVESPNRSAAETYQAFSLELAKIIGSPSSHNPVKAKKLNLKGLFEILSSDGKFAPFNLSRKFLSFYFWLLPFFPWLPNKDQYAAFKENMNKHSDHWKFDDMLRMVLDCTHIEVQKIEALCALWKEDGRIVYGLHQSDSALMTCHFNGFDDGEHIHFIDGGDGGYAMAAKGLKLQLKQIKLSL